jgi:HAD superfamily hydrolase (TIGR01549 family)
MAIQAVFFDLDDTLYDQLRPFLQAMDIIFPDISGKIPLQDLFKRTRYYSDLLWNDYSTGQISVQDVRIKRMVYALKEYGIELDPEMASCFQEEYSHQLNSIRLFDEVLPLFHTLEDKGYKIGIITNGPVQHQTEKLKQLGLLSMIPKPLRIISDEIGIAKPNSAIFHEARYRIGLPARNLLYVGDSWVNDVAAAIEAGWFAVWFNKRARKPQSSHKPLAEITNLLTIADLVECYSARN